MKDCIYFCSDGEIIPSLKQKKYIMEKSTLEERERRELELFMEEFKARGGMDDDEIKARIGAIPMEEFMKKLAKRIETI
jgi:hypothetical protein